MKVSLNWVREYVGLPADLPPEKIAYDLTMTTVEVEGFERTGDKFEKMLVGLVKEVKAHPNADRLRIAYVDLGDNQIKEIVCGGSNLRAGMSVLVAEPGAKVRWHGEGDLIELKKAKIRGVESYGMICASTEVGLAELFPLTHADEIVDLSSYSVRAGEKIAEALQLSDVVFDIDNKSLTNRPDLWGHYGIARELAAIYKCPLKPLPSFELQQTGSGLKVKHTAPQVCSRYCGTLIKGLKTGASPLWLKARLLNIGQRPISLTVDLSNYVMYALGQPTHVFDASKIVESEIEIRLARKGEKLCLLDGSKKELEDWMPVIADKEKCLALAGVMGGKDSSVEGEVESVILEVASFSGSLVRKTSSITAIRTESSIRFEKNIDSSRVKEATELFLSTLQQVEPDIEVECHIDSYPIKSETVTIDISQDFIVDRVGIELSVEQIESLLKRLGFLVQVEGKRLKVTVPSWRATGDVSIPVDLVEEVARLYGYDRISFVPPRVILEKAVRQPQHLAERKLKEILVYRSGMNEIFSYPWMNESHAAACGESDEDMVKLHAPPSPDQKSLVTSLVPNMLAAVAKNYRSKESFGLFEIANVFNQRVGLTPLQRKVLTVAVVDSRLEKAFFHLKGTLEVVRQALAVRDFSLYPSEIVPRWATAGTSLDVKVKDEKIGQLALVSLKTLSLMDIERLSVAVFELDADKLFSAETCLGKYVPLPKFPCVKYELALLFDEDVKWDKIAALASAFHRDVRSVSFVDEYRGEQIEKGKKSLALELTFENPEKTLTSEDVQKVVDGLLIKFESDLGGTLRGR